MECAGILSEFAPRDDDRLPILGIHDRLVVHIVEVMP
jgi:hypothetical protein